MTRATGTRIGIASAPAERDMLIQRYEQAYEAWSRQVAIGNAMRTGRDAGPGDEADHASTYAHVGEQDALVHALRAQLDDLASAVERSDSGSYGRCEECRRAIPAARLALFPAATHCVTCKRRHERR